MGRESGCGLLFRDNQAAQRRPSNHGGFLFSESTLPEGLIQAYRQTEYRVLGPDPLVLFVGIANPELLALLQAHSATCAAFITACNPFSRELRPADNQLRQLEFGKELSLRRLEYLEGIGQHPNSDWPGEPSFFVLGLELEEAKSLGRALEQNAIIWCDATGVPDLVLLR